MTVLTFSIPLVASTQQNPSQAEVEVSAVQNAIDVVLQVKAAAEQDARSDFNQAQWWIVGGGVALSGGIGAIAGLGVGNAIDPAEGCELISTGMIGGLVGGYAIGVAVPLNFVYSYNPEVPAARLLGKSSEHVEIYADTYRRKHRNLRTTSTVLGWIAITGFFYSVVQLSNQ